MPGTTEQQVYPFPVTQVKEGDVIGKAWEYSRCRYNEYGRYPDDEIYNKILQSH